MPKPTTKKSAEKRAKDALRGYIVLRDCLATNDTPDYGRCITCNKLKSFEELDAGHFFKATSRDIQFDERNVHAQCIRCNRFEDGRQYDMGKKIEEKLGKEVIEELESRRHLSKRRTIDDYLEIEKYFREKETELATNQP